MLRTTILIAAGAAAFAAPAAQRAEDRDAARIERALAGLTPGQPRSCINPERNGSSTRYGDTLLIKDRSGVTYLSRFDRGCAPRDDSYAMISRRPTSQACRGDVVQFQDLTSGAFGGSCPYGEFTPYRRPR